jgi:hypothetical protein
VVKQVECDEKDPDNDCDGLVYFGKSNAVRHHRIITPTGSEDTYDVILVQGSPKSATFTIGEYMKLKGLDNSGPPGPKGKENEAEIKAELTKQHQPQVSTGPATASSPAPSTASTQPKTEEDESSCFSGDVSVSVLSGSKPVQKRMADISVGDHIRTSTGFEPVVSFIHYEPNTEVSDFLRIIHTTGTLEVGQNLISNHPSRYKKIIF